MKCFYHKSDLDGHCSGALIKKVYPECEMIGVDYNDTLDIDSIDSEEYVYVVDFSFSLEEMSALNDKANLCWIDHHKSAIEKLKELEGVEGLREIGQAGCELTWNWMYPEEVMPEAVYLLGRYDVWDHNGLTTLPFQYGMRQFADTLPESPIWHELLSHNGEVVAEIANRGTTILKYQSKQDAVFAKGMSYEAEFEGLRAIVINKAYSNSKVFDTVYDPERHDIMVMYGVKPGEWKYSLYSDKDEVDVSQIAQKYGGGGHKGAAGFYVKEQIV